MKRTRQIEIEEIFCDVCGEQCYSHLAVADRQNGTEHHACLDYNEIHGKQCHEVLKDRVLGTTFKE